ncbi:hypothetical protein LJC47_04465 [Desulfosarcina sp. OttesenSCG-928-B08]|nr:hypothetical protein [Desulfosarcina sp. OttesenSCG-928-B08]
MKHTTPVFLLLIILLWPGPGKAWAADAAPAVPAEEVPEILTRGPVHEAFAQPVALTLEDGMVAPLAPPENIQETLPPEKPTDPSVVWIPGYWAWDSEIGDYIWVSGCWRAAPPDRVWEPGYWTAVPGGWQWVSGFWRAVGAGPAAYLPPPPAMDSPDPAGAAPLPDQIWVPPCWYGHGSGYVFRSGYWMTARPGWVWVPSCTFWTPRGHVFVNGYWDYPLGRRGVVFAPMRFPRHLHRRPGLSVGLGIVIQLDHLQFGLFTRPRYRHYYFGDYYDRAYIGLGIFPRYECERRRTWYDPIYVHDRWRNRRTHPNWMKHEEKAYNRIRDTKSLRPPRGYGEMRHRLSTGPGSGRGSGRGIAFAGPLSAMAVRQDGPVQFERPSVDRRQQIIRDTAAVRHRMNDRVRRESASSGAVRQNRNFQKTAPTQHFRPDDQNRIRRTDPQRSQTTPTQHFRPDDQSRIRRTDSQRSQTAPTQHFRPDGQSRIRRTDPQRSQTAPTQRFRPDDQNRIHRIDPQRPQTAPAQRNRPDGQNRIRRTDSQRPQTPPPQPSRETRSYRPAPSGEAGRGTGHLIRQRTENSNRGNRNLGPGSFRTPSSDTGGRGQRRGG